MPVSRTRPNAIRRRCLLPICRLLLPGCCLLLPGCTLIDQRTFDRHAGRTPVPPAPAQVASGPAPVPPLFVVHAGVPDGDWQPSLRQAVGDALARKPNVLFTVEAVAPAAASPAAPSPAAQAAALDDATIGHGRPVAEAILADGAQAAQVEMTALSDPAVRAPEVRIFVH